MYVGKLNQTELEFLQNSLFKNKGMSADEYRNLKLKHPYAVERDDNALILSSMKHYGNHDVNLNAFINKKFGNPNYEIDFFYELTYNVGDYTTPHRDAHFVLQTTLILLSDSFEGGKLLLDGDDVNLSTKGQYINFDGHNQIHEVTEIKSGQRRVLVIMFNKKQTLL